MWPSSSTCDTDASEAILFSEIKKGAHLGPLFDSRVPFRKVAQLAEICYCAAGISVTMTSLLASNSSGSTSSAVRSRESPRKRNSKIVEFLRRRDFLKPSGPRVSGQS